MRKLGGAVFEAKDIATNAPIAVRVLQRGDAERVDREVRAAIRLKSPFVARVLALSDDALVMDLLVGQDLGTELRSAGRIPVDEAVAYLVQACAGVWDAHANGIIHRDLRPSSLFLERSAASPAPRVRVLDFGLSELVPFKASTGTHQLGYQPPEPLRDARSDVWSLGMILYRALRGRLPERDETPRLAADLAPAGLIDVVAKALAKNPDDRFDDAREFGRALLPFVDRPSPTTAAARDALGARAEPGEPGDDPTTVPNPSAEPTTIPRPGPADDDVRDQLPTLVAKDEKTESAPAAREALETMEEIAPAPAARQALETMEEIAPAPAARQALETMEEVTAPPAPVPPQPVTARTRRRARRTNQRVPLIGAAVFIVLIIVWLLWFGRVD